MRYFVVFFVSFFSFSVFAQVSSIEEKNTEYNMNTSWNTVSYDDMVYPGQPFYPTLMYPNLSQEVMLRAGVDATRQDIEKLYGKQMLQTIDSAIDRIMKKAHTAASTKEGKAIYYGEIINKIISVQQQFYHTTHPLMQVLNYIGYRLSVETMQILYGDMVYDVEEMLRWLEG